MARRRIEQIIVGAFPAGTAFNAYIYNTNITIGVAGSPTTVTMNLINESGYYPIDKHDLSATAPFRIQVGSLTFRTMYLIGFDYSEEVGERTLNLKFTDGSIVLDKIQVLLLNKEASPYNYSGRYVGTWNVGATQIARSYSIPIRCLSECENTRKVPWNTSGLAQNPYAPYNNRSGLPVPYTFFADKALTTNVNLITGGAIIIGEEQFVSSTCSIPDVSYTFRELIAVMRLAGLKVVGITDRGRGDLRERFSGGLRQVLTDWCNLYGYSFIWDFGTDTIRGIDLQKPQADIGFLHDLVKSIGDDGDKVAITNIKRAATLEGTYNQGHISTFVRPSKVKASDRSFNKKVLWTPISLSNILPSDSEKHDKATAGRTDEELIISSVLAKYNPTARTLYNYFLIASKTSDFTENIETFGKALGLNIKGKLSDEQKGDIISYSMSLNKRSKVQDKYGEDSSVYIGTYSKELEDKWVAWEKKIADFIGKYYYLYKPQKDQFECNGFIHWIKEWDTKPKAELYDKENTENLPFKDLLKHPEGATLTAPPKESEMWIHSRGPAYGFKDEDLDDFFYEKGEELLKDLLPTHQPLTGQTKMFLDDLLQTLFPDIYDKLETIEDEKKLPSLFFFPTKEKIREHWVVSELKGVSGKEMMGSFAKAKKRAPGTKFNKYEFVKPDDAEPSKECDLICDKDLLDYLCLCPEGDYFDPKTVKLTACFARWFNGTLTNPSTDIKPQIKSKAFIIPSEYPFQGYLSAHMKFRRVITGIKQHFGSVNDAANTMEYKINLTDITSDIEEMTNITDGSAIGGPVKPGEESGQILTSVMVPGVGMMKSLNYHALVDSSYLNGLPKETLTFAMAGMGFDKLGRYLHVDYGLDGLSVSLSDNGLTVEFSYSNKPFVPINQELIRQRIGPSLNSNAFLRTH